MNWLSLIAYIIFILAFFASMYANVTFYFKSMRLQSDIKQLVIDKYILSEKLNETISTNTVENSDGFLKFVTESRDWAFQYIEETQSTLTNFVEKVGPILAYYDKYGRISESESMNKIFDAYQDLVKLLPETNNKENNDE